MSGSPAGSQTLDTVELGETMIISRKGQFLALQNGNQCPRQLEPSVARTLASRNLREGFEKGLHTNCVCSRKGFTNKVCGCRGRHRVSDKGNRTQETDALSQTYTEAL